MVFTVPDEDGMWHGAEEFAKGLGGVVLPWRQAVRETYDLVLAASHQSIDRVRGPVMVLPHGVGALKSRARTWRGHGLEREALVRGGRVVASAIVVSHDEELAVLRESCPEAVPAAVVGGDICLDRMVASLPYREHYRRALGVGSDQALVTVSSTWTEQSTFGAHRALYRELLDGSHRVAAVLHPNIWTVHGTWQVRAWLADHIRAGLLVIPPEEGWRATMIASDVVVGDHGSTTQYAAALGKRMLLIPFGDGLVRVGSPAHELARRTPTLDPRLPVLDQVSRATGGHEAIAKRITSRPGAAGAILRSTLYRMLGLPEPARAVPVSPVPLPQPLEVPGGPR
ncbi:MAG: hypothetical protein ABIQ18_10745 [Umezawaea sp.]